MARVHPETTASVVSDESYKRMFAFLQPQMLADIKRREPIVTTTKEASATGKRNFVYRRRGQPCLLCQTTIIRFMQGAVGKQRSAYACPNCQKPIETAIVIQKKDFCMLVVLLSIAAVISTTFGGLYALKNRDRLHRILGFTAGVLLGVVAFDLLPEIFNLIQANHFDSTPAMIALVLGFLAFHIAEKLTIIHSPHEEEYGTHKHPRVGILSALALAGHSFLDGVGIGLAFQVSNTVGIAVAAAVIAHDFADGLNTVSLMLAHKNSPKRALALLALDALAPVAGAASTLLFSLPDSILVLYLGFFTGFLLYIGASDILPEAHSKHPSKLTLLLTVLGTLFIFIITRAL